MQLQTQNLIQNEKQFIITPQIHLHTIIFLHGLNSPPEKYINIFKQDLKQTVINCKVVFPKAPIRYVTLIGKEAVSWHDVKSRDQNTFNIDFDEAFSSAQIHDSYEKILQPLIKRQADNLKKINPKGQLIISGFSQGCGMALHCFYNNLDIISGVLGIAGYLFEITDYKKNENVSKNIRIIMGLNDKVRPWPIVKVTYDNKIPIQCIRVIKGMGHQINKETKRQINNFIKDCLSNN